MNTVLVAPDSFKGTLSAPAVAAAVARGLRAGGRDAVEMPLGDGGEGTLDALLVSLDAEVLTATVADPLGRPVEARFAMENGVQRGIVEMAEASGLRHVAEDERDAFAASTRGTGELIVAACEAGADEVVVCVGGSATTDGGAGALEALAEAGVSPRFTVVCDVRTAWEDAARVFGPQKGADPKTVKRLERRMTALAAKAPRDPRGVPMTGCAGGLSGGLWAWHRAQLVPGAAYVLDAVGFDDAMRAARLVVTGEGKLDPQTLEGKLVAEVATRARQAGVASHAVVGRDELDVFRERILDLGLVIEATDEKALERAGRELARL
ncbi:MAG: glycerate 2-kinase [Thermoleophilaceae bacterium]|nr:glycerate 2-kinase [Thermoleophilaceae bacterium]